MDLSNQKNGSLISRDTELTGELTFMDSMTIHGKLDGKILSEKGSLSIGKDAVIRANIAARNLTVEGKIDGALNIGDKVVLKAHSAVRGEITSARIVTEDMCLLVGKCTVGDGKNPA